MKPIDLPQCQGGLFSENGKIFIGEPGHKHTFECRKNRLGAGDRGRQLSCRLVDPGGTGMGSARDRLRFLAAFHQADLHYRAV